MFKTRPGNVDDIHFITKSWFLTWVQSPENALRSRDSFIKRTDSILAKKDTNIAVVCYQDNPKYIAAFMVYTIIDTGAIIHCLYVRKNWQMQGIATELLQKLRNRGVESIAFTCYLVDDYLLETTTKRIFNSVVNARDKWKTDMVEPYRKRG
jgi:GNAT superfamily N-acetyltransferase